MNFIKSKIKNALSVTQTAVKNEKGLTLIEMLIAILIFILASVFIVSLVTSALDKPKEAGIKSAMTSYESAAQLVLLETSGDIPGADEAAKIVELNKEVDPSATFSATGVSELKNAYGNTYSVDIVTNPASDKASIIFTTTGAKSTDEFYTAVYYVDGEVIVGTDGFGRNDKDIAAADLARLGTQGATPVALVQGNPIQ